MRPEEIRSGYTTPGGRVIGLDELTAVRVLQGALQGVGASLSLDKALVVLRALRASMPTPATTAEVADDE